MRIDDIKILQGIQKNTDMAMKAIHAIGPKVYDDDLAVQIAREGMKYSEIYHKATDQLIEQKAKRTARLKKSGGLRCVTGIA